MLLISIFCGPRSSENLLLLQEYIAQALKYRCPLFTPRKYVTFKGAGTFQHRMEHSFGGSGSKHGYVF